MEEMFYFMYIEKVTLIIAKDYFGMYKLFICIALRLKFAKMY